MLKGSTRVNCIKCAICGAIIYSRAVHDFHCCPCGDVFVDGGFSYSRYGWEKQDRPEPFIKYVHASKKELYDDWNTQKNKFGIIRKGAQ